MGIIIGFVSIILILSAIYLRPVNQKISQGVFVVGLLLAIAFTMIFVLALNEM